jgi:hypothetical protein
MSYFEDLLNTHKWYVSHEVLAIEVDSSEPTKDVGLMENLILIRADNPDEAYDKAMQHGSINESEITVEGRPGRVVFKGLKELVLIYDELVDGAELEWREYNISREKLGKMLKSKDDLQAFNLIPKDNKV